jgi:hypothetical protein
MIWRYICFGIRLQFSFYETTHCNFVRLENLRMRSTINAVLRVSIGMETQDLCSYVAECLRCSAMSWLKARLTMGA